MSARCDCLVMCGDDQALKRNPSLRCPKRVKAEAENRRPEVIEWVNPTKDSMPDADTVVLMELHGDGEPTWLGTWDGQVWRYVDADVVTSTVTGWAHLPKGRAAC